MYMCRNWRETAKVFRIVFLLEGQRILSPPVKPGQPLIFGLVCERFQDEDQKRLQIPTLSAPNRFYRFLVDPEQQNRSKRFRDPTAVPYHRPEATVLIRSLRVAKSSGDSG